MSCYGIVWRLIRVEVAWWLSLSRLCLVGFRKGQKQKREKKKSRSTVRQFFIYFGLLQTCTDFKSIRIYLFYAFNMVNIFAPERRRRSRRSTSIKQILRSVCDTMMTIMNSKSETSNKLHHDMSTKFFWLLILFSFSLSSPRSPKRRRKDKSRYGFLCCMGISTK